MTRTRQQSAELKRRIVEEVISGKTSGPISKALGVSMRYVAMVAKHYALEKKVGRPKKK